MTALQMRRKGREASIINTLVLTVSVIKNNNSQQYPRGERNKKPNPTFLSFLINSTTIAHLSPFSVLQDPGLIFLPVLFLLNFNYTSRQFASTTIQRKTTPLKRSIAFEIHI
jgi:hypothetical protein